MIYDLGVFLIVILGILYFRIARAAMIGRPDFRVGPPDNPYLLRWYILPRNRWFNVYLHHILRDDDDRALHDHPWWSFSFPLAGELREQVHGAGWSIETRAISRRWPTLRAPRAAHRLEVVAGPCWTLFVTGPTVRGWGFWCISWAYPDTSRYARFVPWKDFVDDADKGKVGRGCGEGEA